MPPENEPVLEVKLKNLSMSLWLMIVSMVFGIVTAAIGFYIQVQIMSERLETLRENTNHLIWELREKK